MVSPTLPTWIVGLGLGLFCAAHLAAEQTSPTIPKANRQLERLRHPEFSILRIASLGRLTRLPGDDRSDQDHVLSMDSNTEPGNPEDDGDAIVRLPRVKDEPKSHLRLVVDGQKTEPATAGVDTRIGQSLDRARAKNANRTKPTMGVTASTSRSSVSGALPFYSVFTPAAPPIKTAPREKDLSQRVASRPQASKPRPLRTEQVKQNVQATATVNSMAPSQADRDKVESAKQNAKPSTAASPPKFNLLDTKPSRRQPQEVARVGIVRRVPIQKESFAEARMDDARSPRKAQVSPATQQRLVNRLERETPSVQKTTPKPVSPARSKSSGRTSGLESDAALSIHRPTHLTPRRSVQQPDFVQPVARVPKGLTKNDANPSIAATIPSVDQLGSPVNDDSTPIVETRSVVNRLSARPTSSAPEPRVAVATPARRSNTTPIPTSHPREPEYVNHGWKPVTFGELDLAEDRKAAATLATGLNQADRAQVARAVQQGFELIQRRAHFSAKARFVEALRVVARSLDDQSYSTHHTLALRRAVTAFEEAEDFFPPANRTGEEVNLSAVLGGHNTPILRDADPSQLRPRQCLREYMAYAEQEFVAALGKEPLASQALYGLGRLQAAPDEAGSSSMRVRTHRALAVYQAAMILDDTNYAAANEMGVLLARYGRDADATKAFQHCVSISPEPTAWRNLARLHHKLGQHELATLAMKEADRASVLGSKPPYTSVHPKVEWVDVETFAKTGPPEATAPAVSAQTPSVTTLQRSAKHANNSNQRFWPFNR